jgi:hypothetical protein
LYQPLKRCWLKNFFGRRLTLPLILNIPQYGDEKMKICPIIEICRLSSAAKGEKNQTP